MKVRASRRLSLPETVVLAFIAIFALYVVSAEVFSPYPSGAYFGWNVGSDLRTISYVTPRSPVEKAGIRVGDRVDWKTLPLLGRADLALIQPVHVGSKLTFTAFRNGVPRTVSVDSVPFGVESQNLSRFDWLVQLTLIGIGIALVRLRPCRMTWGFLFWWIVGLYNIAESNPLEFLIAYGFAALLWGTGTAGILMFVSRFPNDESVGPLAVLDRLAVPTGIAVAAMWLSYDALVLASPVPPPSWLFVTLQFLLQPIITVVAIVALIIRMRLTEGSERQRVLPVLGALALATFFYTVSSVSGSFVTEEISSNVLGVAEAFSELLVAAAVVHGVLRHRVMDVSFVVSRTLVYSLITTIVVATFALIDFVSGRFLAHLQIALLMEAAAALALGIWLEKIHARVDRLVDSVLFRRRHAAEERIRRTARALRYSDSARFIDEALVIEAADAFDLASAAVFRGEGDSFARKCDIGWDGQNEASLQTDDQIVVQLKGELHPIDVAEIRWPNVDLPKGEKTPAVAIPLVVRHQVVAIALYGGHNGGEAIDPDEKQLLAHLAEAAAGAYEQIRANDLARESEALRLEVAMLQREKTLLREMLRIGT